MRNRFTGAMVAATIAAATAVVSLSVTPIAGQAPAAPAGHGPCCGSWSRRRLLRPGSARIGKAPNINGIYQAINTANWNLEDHAAADLKQFWQLGAIAAMPAGMSVIDGGDRSRTSPKR